MTHNQAIEQKFHSCVELNKRKVLVLFLCLSLCFSFFVFPVSAEHVLFPVVPCNLIYPNSSVDCESLFPSLLSVGYNMSNRLLGIGFTDDTRAFSFYYSVPDPSYPYKIAVVSDNSWSTYRLFQVSYVGSWMQSYLSSSSFDSTTNLYYRDNIGQVIPSMVNPDIPIFDSVSSGLAAVRDYIDNPPDPGPELEPFSYSLAPGNVIFIDVSGSDPSDVAVLTSSTGFSYSASELQNTNQAFGYLDSIPSSFTLPLSGTNNIPWAPAGNPNLYGKYQHKTRSVYAYSSNHQYFVVVNPTYDPYTLASGVVGGDNVAFAYDNSNATNSYIDISGFSARAFKVYSLNSQLIYDSGGWSSVTESDGPSYSGSYDSSTQTWTTVNDTSGESESPPLGGTNNIESDATTSETIFAWLETIASSIGSFFRGSIGAVTSLVASGSEFFRSISGLYSWLPSPVLSVLLNALIIAITIGVIKVFI